MLSLIRSKSVVASLGFAFAGAAFTLGNLLLARVLPVDQFGQLALAVAVYNLSIWLAPLGMDQILLRHRLQPGAGLLLRVLGSCGLVALAAALVTFVTYAFPPRFALLLGAAILGGGLTHTAAMGLRHHGWTALPLAATNIASWALLLAGALGLAWAMSSAMPPMIILAGACAVVGTLTWGVFARYCRMPEGEQDAAPPGEALPLMISAAVGALLMQIERFVIPHVLDYEDLATFAVIASVAIFPFRLLRSGSNFALTPRLRAATDRAARFALLASEGKALTATLLIASVVVIALAPFVASIFTGGRYELGRLLVLAACFNGAAKLAQGLPQSAVVACGTAEEIRRLSRMGWFTIAASLLGSWLGARWGLTGLICGSAAGCVIGSIPSALLARTAVARGFVGCTGKP